MDDLRERLARRMIDPHDFPELYDALLIAATKPPSAFRPCRTNAEWRASAFPPAPKAPPATAPPPGPGKMSQASPSGFFRHARAAAIAARPQIRRTVHAFLT
ncbi:MAG: hypothetical protein N2444_09660 [Methylocystis sp.]|nr:hypothetical protein [Methylocystis sp.]